MVEFGASLKAPTMVISNEMQNGCHEVAFLSEYTLTRHGESDSKFPCEIKNGSKSQR